MPHDDITKGISSLGRQNEPPAPTGKTYLLAIGINEYAHFSKLKNAVKDVQDVAALLAARFGFDAEPPFTRFLLDAQATRRGIIHALEALCDLKPEDRALIYYSGHGFLNPRTKHGFWIPVDAEKDDVSSYLPNTTLRDYVKALPCRHILLVSDSCFSGDLLVRDASRSDDGAFEDWEKQRSRWVFCSGKGVVSDGEEGGNSPFATQIMHCMQAQNPAEPLNIASLANEVTRRVRFNYEQHAEASPLFGTGHDGGQFIFYSKKSEANDWQAALGAGTMAAFEDFLKNYPAGQFAAEARQLLEDLRAEERLRQRQQAHDDAYRRVRQTPTLAALESFLEQFSDSPHKSEIRSLLKDAEEDKAWRKVSKHSVAALDEYLEENPYGKYAAEARRLIGEIKAARQREEEARQQSEAEKQAVADLAARQSAEKKRREEEDLRKQKEEDQRRLQEAEAARQQQAAAEKKRRDDEVLRQQKEEDQRRLREAEAARQQQAAAILKRQEEDERPDGSGQALRPDAEERKKRAAAELPASPTTGGGGGFDWRWAAGGAGVLLLVFIIWQLAGSGGEKQVGDQLAATDTTASTQLNIAKSDSTGLAPKNELQEMVGDMEKERARVAGEKPKKSSQKTTVETTDENKSKVQEETPSQTPPSEPEKDETIYKLVEVNPTFPGCEHIASQEGQQNCSDTKMISFLSSNLEYPVLARENGIEGTVIIQFIIEKDGSITNAKIIKDIGGGCGQAALRLVNQMPKWNPGKQRGRAVRVQFSLPIKFDI